MLPEDPDAIVVMRVSCAEASAVTRRLVAAAVEVISVHDESNESSRDSMARIASNATFSVFACSRSPEEAVAFANPERNAAAFVRVRHTVAPSEGFRASGQAHFVPDGAAFLFVQSWSVAEGNATISEGFGGEPMAGLTASAIAGQK